MLNSKVLSSEGLRSSGIMIGGNVIAQGMSGVSIILLSRFIGPEQFGIFSTGFSLALIVNSFIDLGLTAALQQAIPRAGSDSERNRLFSTSIFLRSILFILIVRISMPLSPLLSDMLHVTPSQVILWIAIANIGTIAFNQLAGMLISLKRITQTVAINMTQAVSKLFLSLVVFFTATSSGVGVLIAYLIVPVVVTPFAKTLLPDWYRISIRFDLKSWLTMRAMAINNWIATMGTVLVQNVDILIVSSMMTPHDTGLIAAASRLALFTTVIGGSLSGVLNPRVATYHNQSDLVSYWRKALLVFVGSLGCVVASFLFSSLLIRLTVGDEYLSASFVLGLLLAGSWLAVGLAPLSALFYSYDKPWYFSAAAGIQAVLLIAGNVLLLPSYGINAVGWVRLTTQLIVVVFTITLALMAHREKFGQLPRLR